MVEQRTTQLIYDMTEEQYHGPEMDRFYSSSQIRRVKTSGVNAVLAGKQDAVSDEMRFGTAVHCCALEPDRFGELYVRFDDDEMIKSLRTADGKVPARPRATKEYATAIAACHEAHPGQIVLMGSQYDTVVRCGQMARQHLGECRGACYTELVATWEELVRPSRYGLEPRWVPAKARFDFIDVARGVVYDIKTTGDITDFARSFANRMYHIQAAWYLRGIKATAGVDLKFRIIWIQSDGARGASADMAVADDAVVLGDMEIDSILEDLEAARVGREQAMARLPRLPVDVELRLPNWYQPYGVYR